MKNLIFVTMLFLLMMPYERVRAASSLEAGVSEIAEKIVRESGAGNKTAIAVAAFPHADGTLSVLSNYLVDELVLSLTETNLTVVERSQLERILSELSMGESGYLDVETAKKLGKIHGVDALVIGSITTLGDNIRVIARMISTETGRVFSSAATNIPKTKTIEALMAQKLQIKTPSIGRQQGQGAPQSSFSSTHISISVSGQEPAREPPISAEVLSATYEKSKICSNCKTAVVQLALINTSQNPIGLLYYHEPGRNRGSDNTGLTFNVINTVGVGVCTVAYGGTCQEREIHPTWIRPGQNQIINFLFNGRSEKPGETLNLALPFKAQMDGQDNNLRVEISNIRMAPRK